MQICSIDPSHGCTICSFDFSSNFKVCTSFFNLQISTLASNRALNTSFVSLSHLTSDCELSSNLSEANDRSLHASFVSLPHLTSIDCELSSKLSVANVSVETLKFFVGQVNNPFAGA